MLLFIVMVCIEALVIIGYAQAKAEQTRDLINARARIASLEDILCPAKQHDWYKNYEEDCYICRRCRKTADPLYMDK